MVRVIVAGEDAWRTLVGRYVVFNLTMPWDDDPDRFEGVVRRVSTAADDPRYPWVQVDLDCGGVSVRATRAVVVELRPRVYIQKEETGWAFAVSDGFQRHATGTGIPTHREALDAGLQALGWTQPTGKDSTE